MNFDNESQMLDESIGFYPNWVLREFITENKK